VALVVTSILSAAPFKILTSSPKLKEEDKSGIPSCKFTPPPGDVILIVFPISPASKVYDVVLLSRVAANEDLNSIVWGFVLVRTTYIPVPPSKKTLLSAGEVAPSVNCIPGDNNASIV